MFWWKLKFWLRSIFYNIKDYVTYHFGDIARWKHKIKFYDQLESDYCDLLCHVTNGSMSKVGYDFQTICSVIDEEQEKIYYQIVKDDILDIINTGGTIEDVKEYVEKLI